MAIIGKIQRNSVLLLIIIGGAMLAFIFTDFMNNSGGGEMEYVPVATVYGEEIDEVQYDELRTVFTDREKNNAAAQGTTITEKQEQKADDDAFNEVIRRNIMNREFDKLGLVCTTTELNDMIHGNHIHPWVAQIPIFRGMNGEFSKDSVRNFINNLEVEPDDENTRAQWLEARTQWKAFEDELKDTRKADKYVTLISKGLFVNSLESKHNYWASNEVRSIRFVVQRFIDIPVDEIEVTDEDIKAYYEEHKGEKQYEMQESRDIDYIFFPIEITKEDMEEMSLEMENLKKAFAATDDNVSFMSANSSTFAGSDSTEFRMGTESLVFDTFFGNSQYPESADEAIQNAQVGDVIGPFATINSQTMENELFIAKVTGAKVEKEAWVRHILIKIDATRDEEEAKRICDEIIAEIKEKDNFVEKVKTVSEDPGSIATNGEYKWFAEGRMVPEFNDASFNGAIGQLQLVKTTYGYHIVEVLGRGERVVPKMAVVTKVVKPSENTLKMAEERVYDFIYNVNESEEDSAFYRMAEDSSLTVMNSRVWINQSYITGIEKPKRVMKFAFGKNAMEGDISDPMLDGKNYVVAYLSNIIEEGEPKFEDVKEQMKFPALKDKQAKIYIEKMSNKKSLADVVSVTTNGQILNAQVTYGANSIAGGGSSEPAVIGSIFREELQTGFMTVPIQGNNGVFVCIIDGITPAPETTDYTAQHQYLTQSKRGSADNLVIRALRERADVEDNRRKREYQ
ncbi:MAG: peptidylprolyl isomerase [Crocinitomicaceae bacterium]|nr:peptidylprolyl isomerase [Crocinitomicaceae bacterium]